MNSEYQYHEGEQEVQRHIGDEQTAARNGRIIAKTIVAGALPFLAQLPMVVFGSRDSSGSIWASPLFGEPGFVTAPTNTRVEFQLARAVVLNNDPLWADIIANPSIGMLAIDLATRRRLRINGQLRRDRDHTTLDVEWAYPNCPKYIQRRKFIGLSSDESTQLSKESSSGSTLTENHRSLIRSADTFFVASGHPQHGLDCSHRGGIPGFVQVQGDQELLIPDYVGNGMYNTLGNFAAYPKAGVVFIDFEHGSVLSLSGDVTIDWEVRGSEGVTAGTCRFWRMKVQAWHHMTLPIQPRWEFIDSSPFNPAV